MAIAAHDGADRADQLIAITDRLTTLLSQEIEAHKTGQLDASSQDWTEKEKLAHAYRIEISNIRQDPSLLEGASDSQKESLKLKVESFRELTIQHANALAASRQVTEGLVKAITDEIAETRAAPKGYGRAGEVSQTRDSASSGLTANLKV
jgi:hypothetical protein